VGNLPLLLKRIVDDLEPFKASCSTWKAGEHTRTAVTLGLKMIILGAAQKRKNLKSKIRPIAQTVINHFKNLRTHFASRKIPKTPIIATCPSFRTVLNQIFRLPNYKRGHR
jgi:hypothetical protein